MPDNTRSLRLYEKPDRSATGRFHDIRNFFALGFYDEAMLYEYRRQPYPKDMKCHQSHHI